MKDLPIELGDMPTRNHLILLTSGPEYLKYKKRSNVMNLFYMGNFSKNRHGNEDKRHGNARKLAERRKNNVMGSLGSFGLQGDKECFISLGAGKARESSSASMITVAFMCVSSDLLHESSHDVVSRSRVGWRGCGACTASSTQAASMMLDSADVHA